VATGSLAEIQQHFIERGSSDGSPIVPPTIAAVEAVLEPLGHDPFRSLGVAASGAGRG